MPIADIPELRHTSNAGLYAISPTPPSKKKTSFKAGRSVNFKKRLNDYHLCFNEGYYIYCILPIVKDLYHEDPLAERKKKILALTRRLETELFKLIHHHMELYTTRTTKSEWYGMTNAQLKQYFVRIHEILMFPNTTVPPITQNGWSHLYTILWIEVSERPIAGMTQGREAEGK